MRAIRGYRIQWDAIHQVTATVDHETRRITVTPPGEATFTVDVVAARATAMVLSDAVYRALEPDGPLLAIEADTGTGYHDLRDLT